MNSCRNAIRNYSKKFSRNYIKKISTENLPVKSFNRFVLGNLFMDSNRDFSWDVCRNSSKNCSRVFSRKISSAGFLGISLGILLTKSLQWFFLELFLRFFRDSSREASRDFSAEIFSDFSSEMSTRIAPEKISSWFPLEIVPGISWEWNDCIF